MILWAVFGSTGACAEVYKWTDAQGRVHYADRPMPQATEVEVDAGSLAPSPAEAERRARRARLLETYAQERNEEKSQAARAKRIRDQRRRNCEIARKNSFELEHSAYIYENDAQGNRRILTDGEHIATRRMAADEVKKWCDP